MMKVSLLSLMVFCSSFSVVASDVTAEDEFISQFVDTVNTATSYGLAASRQVSGTVFSEGYQSLLRDLREITSAVQRHLHQPAVQVRPFEPLTLKYRIQPGDVERDKLILLLQSLGVAKKLLLQAKREADLKKSNVMLSYDALLWDLSEVSLEVESILSSPNRGYRPVVEVATDSEVTSR